MPNQPGLIDLPMTNYLAVNGRLLLFHLYLHFLMLEDLEETELDELDDIRDSNEDDRDMDDDMARNFVG